ncbi:MAG: N-acetylmuramoyl-L-alanine amidase [Bacteroidetes bacterium]|nr:N-acetylmuramoyl-L-alanine amidase [Bacteroidota bacterium]MCB0847298.1 N-acetylmuramoyl-L-alanine amidase [Bacteroidota bacterium]
MKSAKFLLFILLLSGFSVTSFIPAPPDPSEGMIKTVIIDPGHGGKDPGAVGKRYYEKDISLQVGLQLKRILNECLPHIKVVMTRDTDEFIELHQRAAMAQDNKGDFFISIHCNALENRTKFGTETYVLGINPGQENYQTIIAENEAILFEENYGELYGGFDPSSPEGFIYFKLLKNVFRTESSHLAQKIQHQYGDRLGRKSRGVKQAPFIVLYLSGMPAILTEMGFITNYEEETFLASEVGQIFLATGIYRAVKAYNMEF